jgi:hypothetical protein
MKLKGRHFNTIELIEAESQTVLNTLTEHDSQDAVKVDKNFGNSAYAQKGDTSKLVMARSPKVSF